MVFEPVLHFLLRFNRSLGIEPDPRIRVAGLRDVLAGGVRGFQLPLVMLFRERIGVLTVKNYLPMADRRLVIFVVATATPPDLYSPFLMGFSLTFLCSGGIPSASGCRVTPNPFGDEAYHRLVGEVTAFPPILASPPPPPLQLPRVFLLRSDLSGCWSKRVLPRPTRGSRPPGR